MGKRINKEWVRMRRVADLDNLELIHATFITHAFSRHTHESFAIGVVEEGVQATDYRGTTHYATAGDVCLVNPGEAHTGYAPHERGWTYRCSYPDVSVLQKAASEISDRERGIPYFTFPVIRDEFLSRLLRDFFSSLDGLRNSLEQESRLLMALAQMIVRHAENRPEAHRTGKERRAVKLIREYIHDHYAENISLGNLAEISNLSRFHLIRVFRNETGLAPHAYLTQVRIREAKRLLSRNVSISNAAIDTGFFDQSHLSKHFKNIVGISPGQYSKMSNNVQDRS